MKLPFCSCILFIVLLSGCAVKYVQLPASTLDQNAVKNYEMDSNYSRVIFYSGKMSNVQLDTAELDRAIEIFIDNNKIGSVGNKEEMIAADLPPGTYSFKCNVPKNDIDNSYTRADILTLPVGEKQLIYMKANFHNETPAYGMMFGALGALATMKFSMVLEQDTQSNGREAIASHRLVSRYIMPENSENSINEQIRLHEKVNQQQLAPNSTSQSENDLEAKMSKLKQLYDKGLITKEEYDLKRKELIEKL